MQADNSVQFDDTGKISLDQIYTRPDPRAYFVTLRELDYCIPQLAKPYFQKLIHEYRTVTGVEVPTILDLGSSYGVNAALLRCDATIDELYEHYCAPDAQPLDRAGLLERDRSWLRSRDQFDDIRLIGLDSSAAALSYALEAGFLDGAVHADLERDELTEAQREQLAGVDLVISTGCIGYIGESTLAKVAAATRNPPWMAHFVLRMFPFDPVARRLAGLGYETEPITGVFKQRRFASAQEQSLVLDTIAAAGVDPRGLEDDGWLYAGLYLSQPRRRETGH